MREKMKKKCADHVRDKGETELVSKLVSEYYSPKFHSSKLFG
jgi:hypothetical protein